MRDDSAHIQLFPHIHFFFIFSAFILNTEQNLHSEQDQNFRPLYISPKITRIIMSSSKKQLASQSPYRKRVAESFLDSSPALKAEDQQSISAPSLHRILAYSQCRYTSNLRPPAQSAASISDLSLGSGTLIHLTKYTRQPSQQYFESTERSKFCNHLVCGNHLRKKRKLKSEFVRICDDCEDAFLYERFMKYEMKTDESLDIQEEIVTLKYEDLISRHNAKQIKLKILQQDHSKLQQKQAVRTSELQAQIEDLTAKNQDINEQYGLIEAATVQLAQMEQETPRSLEQDYKLIFEENQKLTKQLGKLEKRCQEMKMTIAKKEREVEEEFERWMSNKNRGKSSGGENPKKDCVIF